VAWETTRTLDPDLSDNPDHPDHLDHPDLLDLAVPLFAMTILLQPCSDLLDLLDPKETRVIKAIWEKEAMTDLSAQWVPLATLAHLASAQSFLWTPMELISLLLIGELVHQMLPMFLNVHKALKVNPVSLDLRDHKDLLDNVEKLEKLD